jgi:hypothetical protein
VDLVLVDDDVDDEISVSMTIESDNDSDIDRDSDRGSDRLDDMLIISDRLIISGSDSDKLSLHLYFRVKRKGQGKGFIASFWLESKNIGSWSFLQVGACKSGGHSLLTVGVGEHKGVGASFRLEPVNQGVGASFQLDLENLGSYSFLHVGACKQGVGASFQLVLDNLEVGASYECNILIYKK